jgi:hypothetical protein
MVTFSSVKPEERVFVVLKVLELFSLVKEYGHFIFFIKSNYIYV